MQYTLIFKDRYLAILIKACKMHKKYPKLLQQRLVRELNEKALTKTGCFFFINTPSQPGQSLNDTKYTFLGLVVSLYGLYHDLGRQFLLACLDKSLLPNSNQQTYQLLTDIKIHIDSICKVFRASICHGLLPHDENIHKFQTHVSSYCNYSFKSNNWDAFLKETATLGDDDWEQACDRIATESDNLYTFLNDWISEWSLKTNKDRYILVTKFIDKSKASFNLALLSPIAQNHTNYSQNRYKIDNIAKVWPSNIKTKLLGKQYLKPEDIYFDLKYYIDGLFSPVRQSSVQVAQKTIFNF